MAKSPPASSRQNSRFSTLKVFKFAGPSKPPPPPPPKDPYYLTNPSLASLNQSLSPDSFSSQPATPISAGFSLSTRSPSPSPSYAPSSYAPSRIMQSPSTSSLSPDSAGSRKGLFKLPSFTKRPKTPKSTKADSSENLHPPEPVDDPTISMPWNFQHNIHVDEGFVGLPPTWSASLAGMGFSEEEIAAINTRRAAGRTPTLYALQSNRSESPLSSTHSTVSRPHPRSSSLRREHSNISLSQLSELGTSRPSTHYRNESNSSRQHSDASDANSSDYVHVDSRSSVRSPQITPFPLGSRNVTPPQGSVLGVPISTYPPNTRTLYKPPASRMDSPLSQSGSSFSVPSSKDRRPRTPPKRALHVTNDSISTLSSPPPAYKSPKGKNLSLEGADESFTLPPTVLNIANAGTNEDLEENDSSEHEPSAHLPLRLSTIPPRLSLHQDNLADLSSWSESLFSILPGDDKPSSSTNSSIPPTRPIPSRDVSLPSASTSISYSLTNVKATSPPSSQRQLPPQKPLPLSHLPARSTPPPSPATPSSGTSSERTTPLWNEVMSMVRSSESDSTSTSLSPDTPITPVTPALRSPTFSKKTVSEGDELQVNSVREKENRDSNVSTMTVTPATIIRDASIATVARANVVQSRSRDSDAPSTSSSTDSEDADDRSNSPHSSDSHSSASSMALSLSTFGTGSASSGSRPQTLTLSETLDWKSGKRSSSSPYVETSPAPSPLAADFDRSVLTTATVRQYRNADDDAVPLNGPSIIVEDISSTTDCHSKTPSPWSTQAPSPIIPTPRYPGWVSAVVAPLQDFIDEHTDPRELYADLQEIAEGESGSVHAARVLASSPEEEGSSTVAIKNVNILPSGSTKLVDLERELKLLKGVSHQNILTMDAIYVDIVEDSLWICMELMDRSVTDIVSLVDEGVILQEKPMAQIASDVLQGLVHLQKLGIAHRDVRSDNLLVNASGLVKIADFSNAVQVSSLDPVRSDPVGVIYWQAPEIRSGSYNALKVDVWSLGATVWEMAQAEPPFSDVTDASQLGDRWPPLYQSEIYSRSFHDFLQACSEPSSSRPDPDDLLHTPFIRSAGGRTAITQLLSQCRSIEERLSKRQSTESHGTVSLS